VKKIKLVIGSSLLAGALIASYATTSIAHLPGDEDVFRGAKGMMGRWGVGSGSISAALIKPTRSLMKAGRFGYTELFLRIDNRSNTKDIKLSIFTTSFTIVGKDGRQYNSVDVGSDLELQMRLLSFINRGILYTGAATIRSGASTGLFLLFPKDIPPVDQWGYALWDDASEGRRIMKAAW
jgi:hypothetical protein